jgi:hypothetical protein
LQHCCVIIAAGMLAAGADGCKVKALILGLCARQRSIQPYPLKGDLGADPRTSRQDRHLPQADGFFQAKHQVHTLHALPRRAFDQVVFHHQNH